MLATRDPITLERAAGADRPQSVKFSDSARNDERWRIEDRMGYVRMRTLREA